LKQLPQLFATGTFLPSALPPLFSHFTAVAAARISHDGRVIEANPGFAHLVNLDPPEVDGADVGRHFLNPNFSDICAQPAQSGAVLAQGIMTLGDPNRSSRSVHGAIYENEGELWFLGEHDVKEMERLAASVIELNDELTQIQRDLVRKNRELKRKEEEITKLMLTDVLTGLPNRRHFTEEADRLLQSAGETQAPICVAIADIDHFKSVNDTHGHDVGDEVLRIVAARLRETVRESDFAARWGGEEFVQIYPATDIDRAAAEAERIRETIEQTHVDELGRAVTISIGVTTCSPGEGLDPAIKRADEGLYLSKENGRNQVTKLD